MIFSIISVFLIAQASSQPVEIHAHLKEFKDSDGALIDYCIIEPDDQVSPAPTMVVFPPSGMAELYCDADDFKSFFKDGLHFRVVQFGKRGNKDAKLYVETANFDRMRKDALEFVDEIASGTNVSVLACNAHSEGSYFCEEAALHNDKVKAIFVSGPVLGGKDVVDWNLEVGGGAWNRILSLADENEDGEITLDELQNLKSHLPKYAVIGELDKFLRKLVTVQYLENLNGPTS